MAIEFNTIPEECRAQIFFKNGGFTGEEWQAEIAMTGEIMALEDKDGNRYTTQKELNDAGVERITLINHHVVQVSSCDFCNAVMEEHWTIEDGEMLEFMDCSAGCTGSEGHYHP